MEAPAQIEIGGPLPGGTGSSAASAMVAPEERVRQDTPLWMETSTAQPEVRRGAAAPVRSGLHTVLFFGLIVFVVGAAGIGGVALWGPEKPIKNRTQFATNPPSPPTLPSLPAAPPVAVLEEAEAAAVEASLTAEASPPKVAAAPPPKAKKTPKWKRKKKAR